MLSGGRPRDYYSYNLNRSETILHSLCVFFLEMPRLVVGVSRQLKLSLLVMFCVVVMFVSSFVAFF